MENINHDSDLDKMSQWQAIWDRISSESQPPQRSQLPEQPVYATQDMFDDPQMDSNSPELIVDHKINPEKEMSFYDIYKLSQNVDRVFKRKNVNESLESDLGDVAKKTAASPNPIYPFTTGKDSDLNASLAPNSVLRDITDLKVKLETLERQAFADMQQNANGNEKGLQKEVDSLRNKIEELCQKLTPNPMLDR